MPAGKAKAQATIQLFSHSATKPGLNPTLFSVSRKATQQATKKVITSGTRIGV